MAGRLGRRRRAADPDDPGEPVQAGLDDSGLDQEDQPAASPPGRADGPYDVTEVDDPSAGGRVDLGGMWIPGRRDLEVRVEADQASSQVVSVTLVLGEAALQVQPFAAPRSEGIWEEVRAEIRAGVTQQGGVADEVAGPMGTELRTRVPVRAADGTSTVQPARFIGVDGPRWFLRGVLTGRAAVEQDADADLLDLFRDIVVVRGNAPMAPRDPIPLRLPAVEPSAQEATDEETGSRSAEDLKPFQRGPEITEIR